MIRLTVETWEELGFIWEITGDGSPTLRLTGDRESMHHAGGALSETIMIYGAPLEEAFARLEKPQVFSLGLGMGYVEMVAAAHSVKAGKAFAMETMESVEGLKTVFLDWLFERTNSSQIPHQGLDVVADLVVKAVGVDLLAMKNRLCETFERGDFILGGALTPEILPVKRSNTQLYDAYSSKTCPDLWTEEFLNKFLETCCEKDSLFSTYACTGTLKRALRAREFDFVKRNGFHGKRNSTIARRGLFKSETSPS